MGGRAGSSGRLDRRGNIESKKLDSNVVAAIEDYTGGEEFYLSQSGFDNIKENMVISNSPLYRVEEEGRNGDIRVGQDFELSSQVFESKDRQEGALRSFTKSQSVVPELASQVDNPVIIKTAGSVSHLPIEGYSMYNQNESLVFTKGWKVSNIGTQVINGRRIRVITIKRK